MLSSCFAPPKPSTGTFNSLTTESKFWVFRFFMKNLRTCDSVLVPSSSAIACGKCRIRKFHISSIRSNFTLKFWPNLPNPIFANEHSSLVQRWLTRLNETSSDNRPSRHFSFEAFKELIFCLLFWIWLNFLGNATGQKKMEVSWKERRKIWISETFEIPRLTTIYLTVKQADFSFTFQQ